jgi:hypothetical protein
MIIILLRSADDSLPPELEDGARRCKLKLKCASSATQTSWEVRDQIT